MPAALRELARRGITRLLVEGGGAVAASLLRHDIVDRLVWFRAPMLLGGDAVKAVAALGIADLGLAPRFWHVNQRRMGDDVMETYERIRA